MRFRDALDLFLNSHDYSPQTRDQYRVLLLNFGHWLAGDRHITEVDAITAPDVRAYFHALQEYVSPYTDRPLASHTIWSTAGTVMALMNWLIAGGLLPPYAMRNVKRPRRATKLKRVLRPDEVSRLFRALGEQPEPGKRWRNLALTALLLDTGIRAQEACSLRVQDVHLDAADSYVLVTGKGRKQREVGPLSKNTRTALGKWVHQYRQQCVRPWMPLDEDRVFLAVGGPNSGRHLTAQRLANLLRLFARADPMLAGLPLNPHTFRHTFAFNYMQQPGADVLKLSRLLGHSDVRTTEEYLRQFGSREARQQIGSVLDHIHPGSPLPRRKRPLGQLRDDDEV